jgi:hypothetical protein
MKSDPFVSVRRQISCHLFARSVEKDIARASCRHPFAVTTNRPSNKEPKELWMQIAIIADGIQ